MNGLIPILADNSRRFQSIYLDENPIAMMKKEGTIDIDFTLIYYF